MCLADHLAIIVKKLSQVPLHYVVEQPNVDNEDYEGEPPDRPGKVKYSDVSDECSWVDTICRVRDPYAAQSIERLLCFILPRMIASGPSYHPKKKGEVGVQRLLALSSEKSGGIRRIGV